MSSTGSRRPAPSRARTACCASTGVATAAPTPPPSGYDPARPGRRDSRALIESLGLRDLVANRPRRRDAGYAAARGAPPAADRGERRHRLGPGPAPAARAPRQRRRTPHRGRGLRAGPREALRGLLRAARRSGTACGAGPPWPRARLATWRWPTASARRSSATRPCCAASSSRRSGFNSTRPSLSFLRDLLPHAEQAWVIGCGHFPQLETPEQVNVLLRNFLGRLARGQVASRS